MFRPSNLCRFSVYIIIYLASVNSLESTEDDFASRVKLNVQASNDGSYNVSINDVLFLQSADTFFNVGGRTYHQADLRLTNWKNGTNSDEMGQHKYMKYSYAVSSNNITMEAWIKDYTPKKPFITFDLVFVDGANGTRSSNCPANPFPPTGTFLTCFNETISSFPSFKVTNSSKKLGYLTFGGMFMGWFSMQMAEYGSNTARMPDGIRGGVPLVIFDEQGKTIIVSPLDNFMAASMWHKDAPGGSVNLGIMGGVDNVPAGHTFRTILVAADGINKAFSVYGDALRGLYNTDAIRKDMRQKDLTLHYLGYWTDNGAYYYYNTESNKSYEDTLIDVSNDARKAKGIPYKYMQLDSWWYYKGFKDAVKDWSARPDVFPHGLRFLQNQTGYPLAAHNRYWARDTVYAEQNNGSYDFIVEPVFSLPKTQKFWEDLFQNATDWKLILYEQDWLNYQTLYLASLQTDLDLGRTWLTEMGTAAAASGIAVQYCMALPRHALQSLAIPAVTQIRVSEDYHLFEEQWRIGVTSIFADALALAPYKDTFWSTSNQPGNPRYPNKIEPNPMLQAVVSTLSTGPVGPGDELNKTDMNLLMRCCNADGLILKPSKPAKAIDRQIIKHALPHTDGPDGEVWTTYTTISSDRKRSFGILFAANLSSPFTVRWKDLRFPDSLRNALVFPFSNPSMWQTFNKSLTLSNCTSENICLYYFSAWEAGLNGTNIAIFGETSKWVPMSPQRVTNIIHAENNMVVKVTGKPGESVTINFLREDGIIPVTCKVDSNGKATINLYSGCYPRPTSSPSTTATINPPSSQAPMTSEFPFSSTPATPNATSSTAQSSITITATTKRPTTPTPNSAHVFNTGTGLACILFLLQRLAKLLT